MRVYGYDLNGPARGELSCANIEAMDAHYGMESVANQLEWEFASRSLAEAKSQLVAAMQDEEADPELIRSVRSLKAKDIVL